MKPTSPRPWTLDANRVLPDEDIFEFRIIDANGDQVMRLVDTGISNEDVHLILMGVNAL